MMCYGSKSSLPMAYRESSTMIMSRMCSGPSRGGGEFGVVTGFELRLHALPTVSAGTLFFPMSRAGEVLHAWRRWTCTVSNRIMSCGRLLQFPPLPELPEPLRGQAFAAGGGCASGGPRRA
jgi:hypothetical protein